MGCFDSCCAISRTAIKYGDDIVVFPAKKTRYTDINYGPFCDWRVLSFPIYAKYNDYGGVEDVVEDFNTQAMVEFFELPLEKIINAIGGRNDSYNQFSDIYWLYAPEELKEIASKYGPVTEDNLSKYGFTVNQESGQISHILWEKILETYDVFKYGCTVYKYFLKDDGIYTSNSNNEDLVKLTTVTSITNFLENCGHQFLISVNFKRYFRYGIDPKYLDRMEILDGSDWIMIHKSVYEESIKLKRQMKEEYAKKYKNSSYKPFEWEDKRKAETLNEFGSDDVDMSSYMFKQSLSQFFCGFDTDLPQRKILQKCFEKLDKTQLETIYDELSDFSYVLWETNAHMRPVRSMEQSGDLTNQARYQQLFSDVTLDLRNKRHGNCNDDEEEE